MTTSVRTRHHVNPLGLSFQTFRGQRPVLAEGRAVEVEIGCAEAQFLFERAAIDPSRHYIGVEIRHQWVDWVNQQAAIRKVPVQAVFAHANHHLDKLFAPRQVARAFINFPDPWFKYKHTKRRLFDGALLDALNAIMAEQGEVLVQTDIWHLALSAMELFERYGVEFENAVAPWSFWKGPNPFGARSTREVSCEGKRKIWRLLYRRKACQGDRPQ